MIPINEGLSGVSVSHWQGEIDWRSVRNNNISFAFIKATEGTTHQDRTFENNLYGAKVHNITAGAYHIFRGTSVPPERKHKISFLA